jgi:hypothetical protein
MSSITGLSLLITLYSLFYIVLDAIFHNALAVLIAAIAAALVGLVVSLAMRGKKA